MQLLRKLRDSFETRSGWFIRRLAPWGTDLFQDMASLQERKEVRLVLDAGANIGQSAIQFLRYYPNARVHSFEPVASTYKELCANVHSDRFVPHPIALGNARKQIEIQVADDLLYSVLNTIGRTHPLLPEGAFHTEEIKMTSIDAWCAEQGITHLDLLKIDTEGYDVEVLKGASGLLGGKKVKWVVCEAGVDPENTLHVPLSTMMEQMAGFGYCVFGLYEQVILDRKVRPALRRVNVLFTAP